MAELLRPYAEARPDEPAVTDESGTTTWRELRGARRPAHRCAARPRAGDRGRHRDPLGKPPRVLRADVGGHPPRHALRPGELALDRRRAGVRPGRLRGEGAVLRVAVRRRGRRGRRGHADRVVGIGDVPGFLPYEEFLAGGPDGEPGDQSLGWPMIYTSGTTGRPKGVARKLMTSGVPIETMDADRADFAEILQHPRGRAFAAGRARLPLGAVALVARPAVRRALRRDAAGLLAGGDARPGRRAPHHERPPRADPVRPPAPARRGHPQGVRPVQPHRRLARRRAVLAGGQAPDDRVARADRVRVLRLDGVRR